MARLTKGFFARDTRAVARELVGCVLRAGCGGEVCAGRIVEVEAYLGEEDGASHAWRGPTPRSAIMFGPPAVAYVYFIYGMHHCLNVVTERDGTAGAVLVRALEPLTGLAVMARRRRSGDGAGPVRARGLCDGPGKLCQALGVGLDWNGLALDGRERGGRRLWLEPPARPPARVVATPRIGVRRAAALPYRFLDPDSPHLSRPPRDPGTFDSRGARC